MPELTRVSLGALDENVASAPNSYDPTASGINATTIQEAIDELANSIGVNNNFNATRAPDENDDFSVNYTVGSRWIDVTNNEAYICTFAGTPPSYGDAVWEQTTTNIASEIIYTPTPNLIATDVQGAINEVDGRVKNLEDVLNKPVVEVSNTNHAAAVNTNILVTATTQSVQITLPAITPAPTGNEGFTIGVSVEELSSNFVVTVVPTGGDTVAGDVDATLWVSGTFVEFYPYGTNWRIK